MNGPPPRKCVCTGEAFIIYCYLFYLWGRRTKFLSGGVCLFVLLGQRAFGRQVAVQ